MWQKVSVCEGGFSLGQLTTLLELFIRNFYASTGLLGIVLAMTIESCCIPLPSEIVMPLAGVMLRVILPGTNSIVALFLAALAGAAGCLIGSTAAYWIGYKGGRPLMLKYGRYVLISQHDADLADKFFQRWGSATAFFSRLLPVVRTYISIPAGISKMPFVKFCIYTFLGSFPFCLLLAYVGTILGDNLTKLGNVFHGLDAVVGVALVVLVALYIWRHVNNDRKARAAHATAQNGPDGQQPQGPAQAWNQPAQPQQQFSQMGAMGAQQNPSGWGAAQSSQPQQQQWGQQLQQSQQPQQPMNQFQPMQQPAWGQQQPQQQPQQPPQSQPLQFQPMQQGWGQQPQQPQPQQWGQPPQQSQQSVNQFQPMQQQPWGQQPQQPQQWDQQQPPLPQQPSQFQPMQQQWGQPPQSPQPQQWGQQ
jgi:membrane protein DedA with SNARE-associated domain